MKYMVDEMIEDLAAMLMKDNIDCRTVHEWIDGTREKNRKIHDAEVRKFILDRKAKGEEIALITNDYDSWMQIKTDALPVIYVQDVLRDYVRHREKLTSAT